MSKKLIIAVLLVIIFVLPGCQSQGTKITLSSPIEFYSPMMSSAPGFPIEIAIEPGTEKPYKHSIKIKTDYGTILEWGTDMKVRDLGNSLTTKLTTVYWSPFDEKLGLAEEAKIEVEVTVTADGYKSVTGRNLIIKKDEEGMYYIDSGD